MILIMFYWFDMLYFWCDQMSLPLWENYVYLLMCTIDYLPLSVYLVWTVFLSCCKSSGIIMSVCIYWWFLFAWLIYYAEKFNLSLEFVAVSVTICCIFYDMRYTILCVHLCYDCPVLNLWFFLICIVFVKLDLLILLLLTARFDT